MPPPPAYAYTKSPPCSPASYSENAPARPTTAEAMGTPLRHPCTAGMSAAISSAATTRKMLRVRLPPLLVLHHGGAGPWHAFHRPVSGGPRFHPQHGDERPDEEQHGRRGPRERRPARPRNAAEQDARKQEGDHEVDALGGKRSERHGGGSRGKRDPDKIRLAAERR